MKSFLCLLATVAVAYAEADAQLWGYNGLYNNYAGVYNTAGVYNNLYNPAVRSYSNIIPSVYSTGYRTFGKREADAEPEADAQYLAYNGLYNNGLYNNGLYNGIYNNAYSRGLYRPAIASSLVTPSVYSNALRYYGKREAEAEPEADAQYYINRYNNVLNGAYAATYAAPYARTAASVYAAAPVAYNTAASVYGARPALAYNNLNAVRYFGKREAEAEPQYYAAPYSAYRTAYNGYNAYNAYNAIPAYNTYSAYRTAYGGYPYAY